MQACVFSLKVSNVFYIFPESGQNPRNIQFSFAGALIESYKVSPVLSFYSSLCASNQALSFIGSAYPDSKRDIYTLLTRILASKRFQQHV